MSAPNALLARLEDMIPAGGAEPAPVRRLWRCSDVAAAFARCDDLQWTEVERLRARGVSPFALLGYRVDPLSLGWAQFRLIYRERAPIDLGFVVRRARVQFLPRRRFLFAWDRYAEAGEAVSVLVIPAIEDGALIDLVAWEPASGRLASLDRCAGWLSGPETDESDPLVVHPDPMAWLAACRTGIVVVHEGLARPFLLAQPALQAADVAHGEVLDAMLRKVRMPRLLVPAFPGERAPA